MSYDNVAQKTNSMNIIPEIIQPEETESTSTFLKETLKERKLPEFSMVITSNQTAGRGQPGNSWESMPGKNLTFSMVLYPGSVPAAEQFIISKTVAVALTEVLNRHCEEIFIKWPNDIYHRDQKLGGILIENALQGAVISQCIAGIGINVNQKTFSKSIPNPVSLTNITKEEFVLPQFFQFVYQSLIDHFLLLYEGEEKKIEEKYLSQLYRKSGKHRYRDAGGDFWGRFAGIGPAGHLFLKRDDGTTKKYAFKEVKFLSEPE